MNYTFKKTDNGDKTIIFEDSKYIGLQELINTIHFYNISLEDILCKIELVQKDKTEQEEIGSEKAMIEITKNNVEIYDLFVGLVEDEDLFPTIEISTDELKKVITDTILYFN